MPTRGQSSVKEAWSGTLGAKLACASSPQWELLLALKELFFVV